MTEIEEIWSQLTERYPVLRSSREDFMAAYLKMKEGFERGGKLMVCGNGGSNADAQHIVGELMKEFRRSRQVPADFVRKCRRLYPGEGLERKVQAALPAIALGMNQALASAYGNDISSEMVYAQEVFGYGRCGDVLLGLSTSGNSVNVINAVKVARAMDIACIGMGGEDGGALRELCDIYMALPAKETYQVQELALPVYHAWCYVLECTFWPAG